MDWNRLAAWMYGGDPPDYAKLSAHGIATVYADPNSGNAKAVTADLRTHGIVPGIYYDPHWYGGLTVQEQAKKISDFVQVAKLIQPGEPVMLDLELLSATWVAAFIKAYRSYLPSRPTAYTNGPFQTPVVPVQAILDAGFHWYAQLYYGPTPTTPDMAPADGAAIILEIARAGFPADRIHPFYDGAISGVVGVGP